MPATVAAVRDLFLPQVLGRALRPGAVPADVARRDGRARLGQLRRHPRHRRRLRRPPELRHGASSAACWRRRASASASSRSPTGTAPKRSARSAGRTCSSASPPATWTRWSTATRRTGACAATTPTRRDGEGGKRPDRSVIVYSQRCARPSGTCPSSSAASRPRCGASRTSTTGRRRCAARCCSMRKADLLVYRQRRAADRRDRASAGGRRADRRHHRHARHGFRARRAARRLDRDRLDAPSMRRAR